MGRFSFVLQVVIEFANRELLGRVRRFRRRKTTQVASLRRSCRDVCPNEQFGLEPFSAQVAIPDVVWPDSACHLFECALR
jgi:hypothetical protein